MRPSPWLPSLLTLLQVLLIGSCRAADCDNVGVAFKLSHFLEAELPAGSHLPSGVGSWNTSLRCHSKKVAAGSSAPLFGR